MHRVAAITGQLTAQPTSASTRATTHNNLGSVGVRNGSDVVIVSALRTPITKARRGAFKDCNIEDLLMPVMKEVVERTKIDPKIIGDILVGNVIGQGTQRANEIRMASLMAGIPDSVPIHMLNRQCSSGLQAVAHAAANIRAGFYDVALACGVESMSLANPTWEGQLSPKVFLCPEAKDCLLPMGITSENVASQYKITREEQDALALRSHERALAAIASGKFKQEILPITVNVKDPKTGVSKTVTVSEDEGPRADTTREGLAKLKPAFSPKGSTTAGNASQVSDGAAAVLVMTRSRAAELGLPVMGVFRGFSAVGVPPAIMGVGPAFAIPSVLAQTGLTKDDIDVYEINEAFASQALMSVKHIGLDMNKVNPNGGAIALGHPLGCTGARMVGTLLNEMHRNKQKLGVISMCVGSGMGAAAVFEAEY